MPALVKIVGVNGKVTESHVVRRDDGTQGFSIAGGTALVWDKDGDPDGGTPIERAQAATTCVDFSAQEEMKETVYLEGDQEFKYGLEGGGELVIRGITLAEADTRDV